MSVLAANRPFNRTTAMTEEVCRNAKENMKYTSKCSGMNGDSRLGPFSKRLKFGKIYV